MLEESNLPRSIIEYAIDEWIVGRNASRNRAILKRRFCDGVTYERLAEEFDLSTRQVKNIVYKCGDKVLMHLKSVE